MKCVGRFDATEIANVVKEITRQKKEKRDYIYPASKLQLREDGSLVFSESELFQVGSRVYTEWKDAEAAADVPDENGVKQKVEYLGKSGAVPVSPAAERQLAKRLGIPCDYIDRIRAGGHLDLAAHNFTTLLGRDSRKFLVRTLDSTVRAVLSNGYRCLDNADLFFVSADTFTKVGADIWQARLWGGGFQLMAVSPHIRGEVRMDRPDTATHNLTGAWKGEEGDVHNAMCSITNSETGDGGLNIGPGILRGACKNTALTGDVYRTVHIGKRQTQDGLLKQLGVEILAGDSGESMFSEDTQKLEDRVIWLKIRDTITTIFNPALFQAYIDKLNGATQVVIAKPEVAVANVVSEFGLNDEAREAILLTLLTSRDLTKYGLIQAITAQAHPADDAGEDAAAMGFERIGGSLIDYDEKQFAALQTA